MYAQGPPIGAHELMHPVEHLYAITRGQPIQPFDVRRKNLKQRLTIAEVAHATDPLYVEADHARTSLSRRRATIS